MKPQVIGVTGIDGSGKSSVVEAVLSGVQHERHVLQLPRPVVLYRRGVPILTAQRYNNALETFHSRADQSQKKYAVALVNGANVVAQSRLVEPFMRLKYEPSSVWWARDKVVDPAVYGSFYLASAFGKQSIRKMVHAYRIVCGKPAGLLFHLTVDPVVALQRIDVREAEKQLQQQTTREVHHSMHETEASLGELASRYGAVLEYVSTTYGSTVITISTDEREQQEVTNIVSWYASQYESGKTLKNTVL